MTSQRASVLLAGGFKLRAKLALATGVRWEIKMFSNWLSSGDFFFLAAAARVSMSAGTEGARAEKWRPEESTCRISRHVEKHLRRCVDIHNGKTVETLLTFNPMNTEKENKKNKNNTYNLLSDLLRVIVSCPSSPAPCRLLARNLIGLRVVCRTRHYTSAPGYNGGLLFKLFSY